MKYEIDHGRAKSLQSRVNTKTDRRRVLVEPLVYYGWHSPLKYYNACMQQRLHHRKRRHSKQEVNPKPLKKQNVLVLQHRNKEIHRATAKEMPRQDQVRDQAAVQSQKRIDMHSRRIHTSRVRFIYYLGLNPKSSKPYIIHQSRVLLPNLLQTLHRHRMRLWRVVSFRVLGFP